MEERTQLPICSILNWYKKRNFIVTLMMARLIEFTKDKYISSEQ